MSIAFGSQLNVSLAPIFHCADHSYFLMMFVFLVLWWCSAIVINGEVACEDPASLLQRGDVHDKVNLTNMVDAQGVENIVDMEPALQCLRLTTPNIQTLKYPKDAEEHFEQLQKVLAPYVQIGVNKFMAKNKTRGYHYSEGYYGPWIEDQWIEHFMSTWQNRSSGKDSTKRLAEVFGPYIPIFMPYNDLAEADVFEYAEMIDTLRKSLRPDVAYITVVLRCAGLVGGDAKMWYQQYERMLNAVKAIPNVVVLSPAGYGHVPIPHLKQPEKFLQERFFKPMAKRDLLVSYMGHYENTKNSFRLKMKHKVLEDRRCNSQYLTCFFNVFDNKGYCQLIFP